MPLKDGILHVNGESNVCKANKDLEHRIKAYLANKEMHMVQPFESPITSYTRFNKLTFLANESACSIQDKP